MHLWELRQLTSPVAEVVRFERFSELYEAVTPSHNDLSNALDTLLAQNFTPTPDPMMLGWSWTEGNGGSQWPDLYPDLLTVWGVKPGEAVVTAWCSPIARDPHTEREVHALLQAFSFRLERVMFPEPPPGEWEKWVGQVDKIVSLHAEKAAYAQQHPPTHWEKVQLHRWPVRAIRNGIASALDDVWSSIRVNEWSAEQVVGSWHSNRHEGPEYVG